ncbi:MAG: urea transport system permease protein [Actinomycetota bacterium]|jgi:urea transport system permease protein|nr:urea transport system permease protein [Actinomycetota bacterium]MEA2972550.1 urea transport system permease protein [Actinomycetota bacterium]
MDTFLSNLYIGITLASLFLLVGLGLTFTFGQMGVINMAHGEFIMAGAYVPFVLQTTLFEGAKGTAVIVALPVAFVVAGLMGVVLERVLLRRMSGRPLDTLLVTFGVSLILQQLAKDLFSANNKEVSTPTFLRGKTDLFGVSMTHTRLFLFAVVLVSMGLVAVFLSKLAAGRRMRAVMQNRDLAAVSGLPVSRVDATTFFLGSGLAGVAGVAVSLIGPVGPGTGTAYILSAFLVVIVGGVGSLKGAVLAALALGILNSYVEFSTSSTLARAAVFAFVILFLQWRPNGIVSFRTRGLTA